MLSPGQASLPIRVELAKGAYLTSLLGYGLAYSSLDNNKLPTSGVYVGFGQDFAGVGGDVSYLRTTVDMRAYYEIVSDLVSMLHLQAGDMIGLRNGGQVRLLDDFKMGPNLVRGFQPAGIGPRDTTPGTNGDALGGTMYWGASLELQYPIYFLPKDSRHPWRRVRRFRIGVGLQGRDAESGNGRNQRRSSSLPDARHAVLLPVRPAIRRHAGGARLCWRQHHLGFAVRPVAFRFRLSVAKQSYDRTQFFSFGGGTKF